MDVSERTFDGSSESLRLHGLSGDCHFTEEPVGSSNIAIPKCTLHVLYRVMRIAMRAQREFISIGRLPLDFDNQVGCELRYPARVHAANDC